MTTTEVRERPILFSAPMVQAILRGDKTQTRRVIKPQPVEIDHDVFQLGDRIFGSSAEMKDHLFHDVYGTKGTPYGSLYEGGGERIWVRETFAPSVEPENHEHAKLGWTYRADWSRDDEEICDFDWKPSIFMPRAASRITLEITDVDAQRLHEITEDDATKEGVTLTNRDEQTYYGQFAVLWKAINGLESWAKNPWVWVISFKRVTT